MATIGVVHVPFQSHIMAANRLTRAVIGLGHDVIAWAPEDWRDDILAMGAEFRPHEPDMPHVQGRLAFVAELAAVTEAEAERFIEELHGSGVDAVIHDSQTPWARVASEYLGLPRIVSHPMFPLIVPSRVKSPGEPSLPAPDPEEAAERFRATWLSIARRWGVEIEGLANVIHSPGGLIVAFTTEEILGDVATGFRERGWRLVGPLMTPPMTPEMAPAPTAPVGTGRELVYVCFGTSFNTRAELFRTVVQALADEPYDVLISLGAGPLSEADLGHLPENVSVTDFADTWPVLARASVHVTHGGCNSVHESLLAGVPMVCIPQAYDQFPLAERVHELGAGLLTREAPMDIRASVRLLLSSPKCRRIVAGLSERLSRFDGESRVAGVMNEALAE